MLNDLTASSLTQFHDDMLANPQWPAVQSLDERPGAWFWIEANHRYNTLLWNEEDKARRTDVGASEIAACKRLIDQYNQKRNDAVEAIDEAILSALEDCEPAPDARLNSETAGAMIDRLSILSLKIYHMREQTQRVDAGPDHIAKCSGKLQRLLIQRQDLGNCFDRLLAEAREGRTYFKVYRQFKMYNDPSLNPYLYGAQRQGAATGGIAQ
ncbi:DUF4254 domain-containing protein [Noviherbaspirillum denitrificans]|uniref:DUF4254 domain-containing protein n=1 Tax=Noviherbaspirillum denitrificans TaxID=1968433 RepID=A0A254TJB0_9BURK|nr:DUF4254 domain-containing protein [Noviherbaspirillum denitrificans]OWW21402.1 hypothetical protein AYR66_19860 [Noviherbaspirillum denitrificans]